MSGSIVRQNAGNGTRSLTGIAAGNLLVAMMSSRASNPGIIAGYTRSAEGAVADTESDYALAYYRTADASETTFTATNNEGVVWYEVAGAATVRANDSDTGNGYIASTPGVSVVAGDIAFVIGVIGNGGGFDAGAGYTGAWTPAAGWTEDWDSKVVDGHPGTFIAHQVIAASGTLTPTASFLNDGQGPWAWAMQVIVFAGNPPEPGVWVDWDKDGFTDGSVGTEDGLLARMFPEGGSTTTSDNITPDVMSIDIDQGQTAQVTGGSGTDTATIVVQNDDRKYTPDYTSSPIYGKLKPGLRVWIGVNADGTLSGSGQTIYGLFAGKLREIAPIPVGGADSPTAELICDGILLDYRTPVRIADSETRSQYSYRVAVLDDIGEDASRRDLDVEPDTLPLSSADSTDALSVLDALNQANGTRHFIAADSDKDVWYKYTTRNRQYKLGAAADATIDAGSDHLTTISGWRYNNDGIINHQKASIDPVNFPFAIGQVWTYDNVPFTLVGANKTIWANFDDYVRDPILTVTSSGTAVTSTLTPFGHTAMIELFAANATITHIKITGQQVIREQGVSLTADDLASQAAFGVRAGTDLSGDLIGASASAQGIVDHLVYRYGSRALKRPEIETHNWLPYAFSLRPYDQIGVTVDAVSASAMKFEIVGRKLHCDVAASATLVDWIASFTLAESRIQGEVTWFTLDVSVLNGPDLLGY